MSVSILSGIRRVRVPLVAGYLWLLGLWIAFEPWVKDELGSDGPLASVGQLDGVAKLLLLGIVSFAAYLIGTVVDGAVQTWRRRSVRGRVMAALASPDHGASMRVLSSLESVGDEEVREAEMRLAEVDLTLAALPESLFGDVDLHGADERGRSADRLSSQLRASMVLELPLVADRLVEETPLLFSAVERLRAEAQLRFAVALSLPVVLAVCAARSSPWWLLGLVVALLLWVQGRRKSRQADGLLTGVLRLGRVDAPAAERLRRAVDDVLSHASHLGGQHGGRHAT